MDRYAGLAASGGYELLSTAIAAGLWHLTAGMKSQKRCPATLIHTATNTTRQAQERPLKGTQ